MNQGFVHVYTGDGKGKTTAATGLAVRALGAGMKVAFLRFIKKDGTSEQKALSTFGDRILLRSFGQGRFGKKGPSEIDIAMALEGLAAAKAAASSGEYDLVILDEANVAASRGLFPVAELLAVIRGKAVHTELVLTGRRAAPEVMEAADLVTEMKPIKHYFTEGVSARYGIEK